MVSIEQVVDNTTSHCGPDYKNFSSRRVLSSLSGMEDFMKKGESSDSYDVCGHNDIRLPYNPCGCVYQMDVEEMDGWMQVTKVCGYLCGSIDSGTNDFDICDVNSM